MAGTLLLVFVGEKKDESLLTLVWEKRDESLLAFVGEKKDESLLTLVWEGAAERLLILLLAYLEEDQNDRRWLRGFCLKRPQVEDSNNL